MRLLLVLVIVVSACNDNLGTDKLRKQSVIGFQNITLIDTFQNRLDLDSTSFIIESDFHPLFIGKLGDTIQLSYLSIDIDHRTLDWDAYRMPNFSEIAVFVDTTKIVGSGLSYIPSPPVDSGSSDLRLNYEVRGGIRSYPVFVSNLTSDTLIIGYGEYLPIVIEAVDSLGNWSEIQVHYRYSCGTGLTHFYLPPEEGLITSCPKFFGTYRTKMRLAYGWNKENYSNEFYETIDYEQFEGREEYY